MTSNSNIVIAFDLYGTLLSTESIAKELAVHFGNEKAQQLAALWRRFQLEYTWRMNSMKIYKPFSDITQASLKHALGELSLSLSDADIKNLMKAYDSLETFPDVEPALTAIASDTSIDAHIFSNGTDAMVGSSINQSPSLSPHASVFRSLVTVHDLEVFKPDPRVYQHLATKVGKTANKEDMATVWLVTANPFDVVGARAAGMPAAWIDRAGGHSGNGGWNDRLGDLTGKGGPTLIANGVEDAVKKIKKWSQENRKIDGVKFNETAAMGPG